jgi:hypothetical protein
MSHESLAFGCNNRAGEFAEACVTADLLRFGFEVLRPVAHTSRFDLGVYQGGRLIRLQVKLATLNNNVIKFYACSSKQRSDNRRKDYVGLCELIVGYCPITQCSYAIRPEDCPQTVISLRIVPARQTQGVKMAEDHRLKTMIEQFATVEPIAAVATDAGFRRIGAVRDKLILSCREDSALRPLPVTSGSDSTPLEASQTPAHSTR